MYKTILAAALCATAPAMCRAQDSAPTTSDTNAMLNQVIQIASAGQTPETQAEVKKYVQDNQGPLTAILNEAMTYISQAKNAAANGNSITANSSTVAANTDSTTVPAIATSDSATSQSASPSTQSSAAQMDASESANIQPSKVQSSAENTAANLQQPATLQTSSPLQTSGLTTGHLAGYPSLPAVDPISSVKKNTPEQAEYVQKVNAEEKARKESLRAQSEMGN